MLALSGAPNCVVSWPDFSLMHKAVRKLKSICRTIFSSFYVICHFNYKVVLYVCCLCTSF